MREQERVSPKTVGHKQNIPKKNDFKNSVMLFGPHRFLNYQKFLIYLPYFAHSPAFESGFYYSPFII